MSWFRKLRRLEMTWVGAGDKRSTNGSVSASEVVDSEALSSPVPSKVWREVDEVMASGLIAKGRVRPFGRGEGRAWVRRGGRVWFVEGVGASLFGSACPGSETGAGSSAVVGGPSCGGEGSGLSSGGRRGSHQCRTHWARWLGGSEESIRVRTSFKTYAAAMPERAAAM